MTTEFDKIKDAYHSNMFASPSDKIEMLSVYTQLEDLNITSEYMESLYHLAARFTDSDAINFLKDSGVSPTEDSYGNTALHALTTTRFDFDDSSLEDTAAKIYKTAVSLLDAGINPKKKNDSGKVAYFEAGELYMYPFIQAMAESNLRMDFAPSGGQNVMHVICDKLANRKDIPGAIDSVIKTVQILVENASIDIEDMDVLGNTPLIYAQRSGVTKVAALITGNENDISTGGMTIHQAVLNRDVVAIAALINLGTDLNEIDDQYHRTALMLACEYPSAPIVKLLAEGSADVNFKSGNGETATYYLLTKALFNLGRGISQYKKDIITILKDLLKNGLDADAIIDNDGNTGLNLVCQASYLADLNTTLCEELINGGANVNRPNQFGKTPFMSFCELGNENKYSIGELLIDNGAEVNYIDQPGNTALSYAAGNPDHMSAKKLVSLILDKDRSILEQVNNLGQTAMDIAIEHNNESVVKQLMA
ncbi:MAG: ankyrin repeat domain-containing protein [Pedobacter sp.]|nr:MAG: ankyrin repeat domain-containing protein [Pedobacter sp.]